MAKERGETGRYVETTTLDAVFGVFAEVRGPVVTSADVADALDCSRDTARRKLTELYREGEVERRETAGRVVWWLSDDSGCNHERNRSGTERVADPANAGDGHEHVERTVSAESTSASVESIDVEALDLPGQGDDLQRRQAAVRAVLDYLRENDEAQASELKDIAWEEDGESYSNARSLWKNCVLSRALSVVDVVESAGPSGKWRWSGDCGV